MTLFKQIMIAIFVFGLMIFTAVGYSNFKSLSTYIDQQLGVSARDTANSLGLSLKPFVAQSDLSMAETMISSMFDSGYYQMIRLNDLDNNVLIENSQKLAIDGIPSWFLNNVNLDAPIEDSEIMTGWTKFGTLYVQSSTGLAYYELYNGLKSLFYRLLGIFIVMLVCAYFGLRAIFKPLENVQKQAEAILDNRFIVQEKMPFTTDLRHMVLAMNSMVKKVKDIFEKEANTLNKYQELLYKDNVSGAYNRRYFQTKFTEYITSEEFSTGISVLMSFKGLSGLKKGFGFEKWQSLIIKIAQILQLNGQTMKRDFFVSRLNDDDFIIIMSGVNSQNSKVFMDKVMDDLSLLFDSFSVLESDCFINASIVDYNSQTTINSLLTTLDVNLANIRNQGNFKYKIFDNNNSTIILGKEKYKDLILRSMKDDKFKFATQKVVSDDKNLEHYEIYLRLITDDGKWQMASYFMPMVNELEFGSLLDLHVIDRVNKMILADKISYESIAINLGKEILSSELNFTQLQDSLKKLSLQSKSKIFIEVPTKADISLHFMIRLSKLLKECGFGFGMDGFEFSAESIEKIKEISPNYVKIRAANIIDFFSEDGAEHTIKSLDVIMNSKGTKLIAVGVESNEQQEKLAKLGITSMQGIYIDDIKDIG